MWLHPAIHSVIVSCTTTIYSDRTFNRADQEGANQ